MMGTYLVTIENGYMIYEPSIVNLIPTYDENENTWKINKDKSLVIGENGNNNIAYLDYSNNPYSASSIQTKSSNKIPVYTYEIDMKVVDRDNENLVNENTNDIDYMDVLNLNKDGIMGYLEIPKISLRLPNKKMMI